MRLIKTDRGAFNSDAICFIRYDKTYSLPYIAYFGGDMSMKLSTEEYNALFADRAALLYETYCKAVGGKAHDGKPLPSWQEFRADPARKVQADAWEAIAGV